MFGAFFSEAWSIALVILGFGFLIFIHEFGHFIVAKRKGVLVSKFSLGFGPALIRFTIGETEYAVSIIPLGGYCKLAGEMMQPEEAKGAAGKKKEDENVPPERLLSSKSVGQRMQIFAAGALMNLIAAFPLGILMAAIGGQEVIPQVSVLPGSAYEAGIHSGDIITSVNGTPVEYWFQVEDAIEDIPPGTPFSIELKRDGRKLTYQVTRKSEDDDLGLAFCLQPVIGGLSPAGPGRKAGLRIGDRITAVKPLEKDLVPVDDWSDFERVVRNSPGMQIIVRVQREDPDTEGGFITEDIPVTPEKVPYYSIGVRLDRQPYIGAVQGDSPAARAGFKPGDRIVSIDGNPVRNWSDITTAIANGGVDLAVTVERDGEELRLAVHRPAADQPIGIASSLDRPAIVAEVEPDSPAARAGLKAGDLITSIDGTSIAETDDITFTEEEATIEIIRDGRKHTCRVEPEERFMGKVGVGAMSPSKFRRPPLVAVVPEGFERTIDLYGRIFSALWKLVTRKASTRKMAGPVGIISLSYMQARTGLQQFVFFLMMVSISLGIFNLLPVPVLDGGHIVFLLIEKIKGKPVSERTFVTAQYVGLALLLCLVLFATTNDFRNYIF